MKRARFTGEAAVNRAVYDLLNKFEYPDAVGGGGGFIGGGGGGAMSIQVAAADALDIEKQKADFICPGIRDADTIQAAADLLHAAGSNEGGRILLSSGQFDIGAGNLDIGNRVKLEGVSAYDTRLFSDGETGTMLTLGFQCEVESLTVFSQNATVSAVLGIDMDNGSRIDNCWFRGMRAIEPANQTVITRCGQIAGVWAFIDSNSQGFQSVIVANNTEISEVDMDAGKYWIVKGNTISDGIVGEGTSCVVSDNTFVTPSPAVGASAIIELTAAADAIVANNSVDGNSWDCISVSGDKNLVVGNVCANPDKAIVIDGDRNLVEANMLRPDSGFSDIGVQVVSGECNMIVGNDLGDPDDYATDALDDNGANTQLVFPNDATYGDNFTDCGTGS